MEVRIQVGEFEYLQVVLNNVDILVQDRNQQEEFNIYLKFIKIFKILKFINKFEKFFK